jgi:hypothetical protein
MRRANPPAFAVWILEHLVPGDKNEALAGDLSEEFRHGRSVAWYWRQVLGVLLLGCLGELRFHWLAGSVAVLWAVPSPAFCILFVNRMADNTFVARCWSLAWPYSTICDMAFHQGCEILYLWSAIAAYFLLSGLVLRNLNLRGLMRGLRISAFAYLVVFAATLVFFATVHLPPRLIDIRHASPLGLISDVRFIADRVPVLLTLLASLRTTSPRGEAKAEDSLTRRLA